MFQPLEVSLSSIASLTHNEASGETMRRYGMRDDRDHQSGATMASGWQRFLVPAHPSPKPSARRAGPHPPLSAA